MTPNEMALADKEVERAGPLLKAFDTALTILLERTFEELADKKFDRTMALAFVTAGLSHTIVEIAETQAPKFCANIKAQCCAMIAEDL